MKSCRYGFLLRQRQHATSRPLHAAPKFVLPTPVSSELLFKQDNKLLLNAMIHIVFIGTQNLLSSSQDNKFYSCN
jgi:hypothetical protein